MLPPDTAVMCVTSGRILASRRKRTMPRWYKVARKPPPESARPIFMAACTPCGDPTAGFCPRVTYQSNQQLSNLRSLFRHLELDSRLLFRSLSFSEVWNVKDVNRLIFVCEMLRLIAL